MELRPNFQIQTVIKALKDVILPAVDPGNKLALEQGHLAIGHLTIVLHSLPLMYHYDRDELSRFLTLGATLQQQATGLPGGERVRGALADAMAAGADILEKTKAAPHDLEAANFLLREKIGAMITALYAASDAATLSGVATAVLAHAQEQLLRERALLISQGWEADPKSIPAIETLIGA